MPYPKALILAERAATLTMSETAPRKATGSPRGFRLSMLGVQPPIYLVCPLISDF